MFIYVIRNNITGKVYIGQHKGSNLRQYLQKKFYYARIQKKGSSYLFNAMRKYPDPEQWSIEPLFEGIEAKEKLDRLETLLIALYDTRNPEVGYNICRGGEGFTGTHSPEARAKLSVIAKKHRPWIKAAQMAKGVPRPADIRAKIAKAHTGKRLTPSTRDKIRKARFQQPDPRLGKLHSEETKRQISDAKKGNPSSFLGKCHTDAAKEKNRQAHLIDLRGQRFGTVIPLSVIGSSSSKANWLVQCVVCKAEGVVRGDRVRNGDSRFMKAHICCKNLTTQPTLEG